MEHPDSLKQWTLHKGSLHKQLWCGEDGGFLCMTDTVIIDQSTIVGQGWHFHVLDIRPL